MRGEGKDLGVALLLRARAAREDLGGEVALGGEGVDVGVRERHAPRRERLEVPVVICGQFIKPIHQTFPPLAPPIVQAFLVLGSPSGRHTVEYDPFTKGVRPFHRAPRTRGSGLVLACLVLGFWGYGF